MKMLRLFRAGLIFCLAAAPSAFGQSNVYSINIVGYYNRSFSPGNNLVANQLLNGDNALNTIFTAWDVPNLANGATFTKWDPAANQFLTPSVYDSSTATWSINYTLGLGEGGVLNTRAGLVNTFAGEVDPDLFSGPGPIIDWSKWTPGYADGIYLLSSPLPIASATFDQVVGRAPRDGEWVETLDEATQTSILTTFHTGLGWDNGAPALDVGKSGIFGLGGPTPALDPMMMVPEPSSFALAGLGALAFLRFRRRPAAD